MQFSEPKEGIVLGEQIAAPLENCGPQHRLAEDSQVPLQPPHALQPLLVVPVGLLAISCEVVRWGNLKVPDVVMPDEPPLKGQVAVMVGGVTVATALIRFDDGECALPGMAAIAFLPVSQIAVRQEIGSSRVRCRTEPAAATVFHADSS